MPFGKSVQRMMRKWSVVITITIMLATLAWVWDDGDTASANTTIVSSLQVTKLTEPSEYQYLLLPDSTEVWLNVASSLEFPEIFNKDKREVVLKGEAFFDVKPTSKTPFIIYTGDISTEVLGAALNIKAYPGMEKITVSVKRGKAKVDHERKQVALLTLGQRVNINPRTRSVDEKRVKENEIAAWHRVKCCGHPKTVSSAICKRRTIEEF